MSTSRIEWTERTWNPVVGCTKVSAGCKHCYAETMANRLRAMGVAAYKGGFTRVTVLPERLIEPLVRRVPTIYFVNSMSDLFHEEVPESFIDRVFSVMERCPQHTFQVLTKRSVRLHDYSLERRIPPNVWVGVSVENRRYGLPRLHNLRLTRARVRFLSVEPLLEDIGELDLTGIQWVIVGGESGHGARRMSADWVRGVRDQCLSSGVKFFFKHWGAYGPDGNVGSKKLNGRELDGVVWDEMPSKIGAWSF